MKIAGMRWQERGSGWSRTAFTSLPSPGALRLEAGQAEVWCVRADRHAPSDDALLAMLGGEERGELAAGHPRERRERVLSRIALRFLLSAVQRRAYLDWRFAKDVHGKPGIVGAADGLQFNVAHGGGMAAVILARDRAVGIDVEDVRRRLPRAEDLVLSASETTSLARLAPAQQRERFFAIWTCKEAFGKGLGLGLAAPLDALTITRQAGRTRLVQDSPVPGISGWSLFSRRWGYHRLAWALAGTSGDRMGRNPG